MFHKSWGFIENQGDKNPKIQKKSRDFREFGIFWDFFRDSQIPIPIPGIPGLLGFFDLAKNKKSRSRIPEKQILILSYAEETELHKKRFFMCMLCVTAALVYLMFEYQATGSKIMNFYSYAGWVRYLVQAMNN